MNPCPVGWGCRIPQLRLCRGGRTTPYKCPGYDTKQSDCEVPLMEEFWGMRSIPSLPSLSGPLWPGMVASDRVLSMSQIKVNWIARNRNIFGIFVLMLNWIVWNGTVFKSLLWGNKIYTHSKLSCLNWNYLTELNCLKQKCFDKWTMYSC